MRAFFLLLEQRASVAYLGDLRPPLTDDETEALLRAGILRPTDRPDMFEISYADLARCVRALWRVQGRGLPVPAALGKAPDTMGWVNAAGGERCVIIAADPGYGLLNASLRKDRTLVLVPTARHVTPEMRARRAPDERLIYEVLEEALTVRRGRLARSGEHAPDAAELPAPASARASPAGAPAESGVLFPGAKTWVDVSVHVATEQVLLVIVGGRRWRVSAGDCGMASKVSRRPKRAWELLHALCDGNGTFLGRRFGGVAATKRSMSRLRRDLQRMFGLEGDPFFPFRHREGWHTRFRAHDRIPEDERDLSPETRAMLARARKR